MEVGCSPSPAKVTFLLEYVVCLVKNKHEPEARRLEIVINNATQQNNTPVYSKEARRSLIVGTP